MLLAYAVLYGLTRFTIEFFRDDPRGDIFGLTTLTGLSTSQIISLIVVIGGLAFLLLRRRRRAPDSEGTHTSDTVEA